MTKQTTHTSNTTKLHPNARVLNAPLTRSDEFNCEAERARRDISVDILTIQVMLDLELESAEFEKRSLAFTRALCASLMKYATSMKRLEEEEFERSPHRDGEMPESLLDLSDANGGAS